MSEKTEVTNRYVGFHFDIKIEKEIRTETGAKYPDKSVYVASLSGNAETFMEAVAQLHFARKELEEALTP